MALHEADPDMSGSSNSSSDEVAEKPAPADAEGTVTRYFKAGTKYYRLRTPRAEFRLAGLTEEERTQLQEELAKVVAKWNRARGPKTSFVVKPGAVHGGKGHIMKGKVSAFDVIKVPPVGLQIKHSRRCDRLDFDSGFISSLDVTGGRMLNVMDCVITNPVSVPDAWEVVGKAMHEAVDGVSAGAKIQLGDSTKKAKTA